MSIQSLFGSFSWRAASGLCAVLALTQAASATTRFVNVNLTTGANNGSSWADAYRDIDGVVQALTASSVGDEVWVAQGLYKPTATATRTLSHNLKTGVAVYGGFIGNETTLLQRDPATHITTLSGDLAGNDGSNTFTDNSFHVVNGVSATATAILDGFLVTGGNANSSQPNDRGGGILMQANSNGTIRNCTFRANRCNFGGGAGYINSSSPSFTNCRFENNVGGSFGGAFDMASNVAATFDRCIFSGNTAGRAGGIEIFGGSSVKVYNSLFFNNTATGSNGGGAIWIGSNSSPQIRNVTVFGNNSTVSGAAGLIASGGAPSVANSIFYGNTGPGGSQTAANQLTGITNVTFTCVQGGFAGAGNISADPGLVDPAGGNYALSNVSPCIDAGNNAAVPPSVTLDLAGNPRYSDEVGIPDTGMGVAPIVDMGAYEFPAPSITNYCFGDGFGNPCPCGNNSAFGFEEGCLSSLGVGGRLRGTGVARISNDSLVLTGSQMPNASALYFQGTMQVGGGLGATFGDGLRCAGGTVIRLGTKTNVGGTSQYPSAGDPDIHTRGLVSVPGSVRDYQVWYRNAASFCAPEAFNVTNGVEVVWQL